MVLQPRIRKWYRTAGFVGVVAGLTVTGGLAAVADSRRPGPRPSAPAVAGDRLSGQDAGQTAGGTRVGCDPDLLIAAIQQANGDGGRLELTPGCVYVLTSHHDGTGLPAIIERVTIVGHGATIARAANAPGFRFFTVESGGELTLRGVTLTGGQDTGGDGGGAILVRDGGFAALTGTTLDNNQTDTDGGAILSRGVLAVDRSTLIRNMARGASSRGGAIASLAGQVTVDDSRLDDNATPAPDAGSPSHPAGGALFSEASVVVIRYSSVRNNRSELGGALRLGGPSTVADTTVSGNQASSGGGLYVTANARVTVRRGLISGNSIRQTAAADSGGIFSAGNLLLEDTRVTANAGTDATAGIEQTGTLTVRGGGRRDPTAP